MRIWLHSDDMAASRAVSETMLEAWREGSLDGFSVIANGTGLEELRRGFADQPDRPARVAVHLNLSEGPSSADPQSVAELINAEGLLDCGFSTLALARWSRSYRKLLEQIEREWRAQIRVVQCAIAPRSVSLLDGHGHVHMIPGLFEIAARLAVEEGIPAVRVTREPFFFREPGDLLAPFFILNNAKRVLLRLWARRAERVRSLCCVGGPDLVVGVLYSGRMSAEAALRGIRAAERCGASELEVFFHAGRAREEERPRWRNVPRFADFYTSDARDSERYASARLRALLRSSD